MNGQFRTGDEKDGGEAVRHALLATCRQASEALVVIEDHPLTRADRRTELASLRTTHGESRPIERIPGHLVHPTDDPLIALLRVCVGSGSWWSTYLYLAPIQTTMLVWESSLVDLWSTRESVHAILKSDLQATNAANNALHPTRACGPRG